MALNDTNKLAESCPIHLIRVIRGLVVFRWPKNENQRVWWCVLNMEGGAGGRAREGRPEHVARRDLATVV